MRGGASVGGCARGTREPFVAAGSWNVPARMPSATLQDQQQLREAFRRVVAQDRGEVEAPDSLVFRQQDYDRSAVEDQLRGILGRVNRLADRRFHVLDVISVKREIAARGAVLVERYRVNLFVQEKDARRVHAAAYELSLGWLWEPGTGRTQVTTIRFVSDDFNEDPLVPGRAPEDKWYRMTNRFHLQLPFATNEQPVLPAAARQVAAVREHARALRRPRFRCFTQSDETVPARNERECEAAGMVWDAPASADEDCPFYRANKNYENRLGGVHPDGKHCLLPVNAKPVGYRSVSSDPAHKPWCYNCRIGADGMPGSIGPCCEEQRNRQLYPNLVTPDYAFPGDALERGQHWKQLRERGLEWQRHPTRVRHVRNPKQRQPVLNAVVGNGP